MPDDSEFIYLDNHSTTRVDPRVVETMLPVFESVYANPGNISNRCGEKAAEWVDQSRNLVAASINAADSEIIFTSGATESNNLALFGICHHKRNLRKRTGAPRIISVCTEHRAVLDPLHHLGRNGFEVVLLPVDAIGQVDLGQFEDSLDENTVLVTVMLANNEIGTLQPLRQMADLCRRYDVWFHTDATQAIGRLPVDVQNLDIDLLSMSAHKFYGPKGVGVLYVRQSGRRARLAPGLLGGGQELGLRSGTLNVPGIVGLGKAIEILDLENEPRRLNHLANQLLSKIRDEMKGLPFELNGPTLGPNRLPGNLNFRFPGMDGQLIMAQLPDVALSSGSACSAAHPDPSHVLTGIGLSADEVQASLRIGIGRFNDELEIEKAGSKFAETLKQLWMQKRS